MFDSLKKLRRKLRIKKNVERLFKENEYYHSLFAKRELRVPLEAELFDYFRKLFPLIEKKSKGQLRILAVFPHYNWERDALLPSLRRFGEVTHYDWQPKYDHQGKDWLSGQKQRMNSELIGLVNDLVQKGAVDVIFTYLSGELVFPETVQEIASHGIPVVNMFLNDKEIFVGKKKKDAAQGMRDICRHFHLCWTSTEDALEKYCVEGATPIYLPEGANPEVHRPYDVEQDTDVSFVGQCYGVRPMVAGMLQERGIAVSCYGYGWPNGPLSTEEMVKMYSRSKINVGFGGVDNLKEMYCLKGRDFEVPMSGGFYLTEDNDELARCFVPGKEIATYRDFEELVSKVSYYLKHDEEREEIRRRGYERALAEHTWEKRFEKVFTILGVLKAD
ncbi:MAG: glycosyltransferase [Desulfobulbaceae bacterium]|nr:glycosyltransferase [Desulfobulbaceae bacterium]HIJ79553.1 glycosyltransferase [Deltaproteobacteria bacterium]